MEDVGYQNYRKNSKSSSLVNCEGKLTQADWNFECKASW